jgi:hypothetical protein
MKDMIFKAVRRRDFVAKALYFLYTFGVIALVASKIFNIQF